MATRARNGSARPRGGQAEAALEAPGLEEDGGSRTRRSSGSGTSSRAGTTSRGGSGSRASKTSGSTTTTRSPAQRGTSGKPGRGTQPRSGQKKKNTKGSAGKGRTAKGRAAKGRPGPGPGASHDPVVILIGWTGRTIAAAWMLAAGAVGFAARAVGRGARDLDPHHRRDGLGLLTLGVAIVFAASLWGRMGNAVGRAIHTAATGAFGSLAWVIPVLAVPAGLAVPAAPGPQHRDGPRVHRLDRAAARRGRTDPHGQGHAAPVRRRARDACRPAASWAT